MFAGDLSLNYEASLDFAEYESIFAWFVWEVDPFWCGKS